MNHLQGKFMLSDIPNQDLPVKLEKQVRIQRGKHDKEHPYANISKKMLRDMSLSPRDKGALCYLLSLPDNWEAHPRQVAESLGISKNQMYDILKCLIQTGYASKEEIKCSKGRFSKVVYYFYEEKLDLPTPIKEKSTVSQNPDTDNPDTEKGTLKNTYYKENIPEGINNSSLKVPMEPAPCVASCEKVPIPDKPKKTKPDFTPKVREFAAQMLTLLETHEPMYRAPDNMNSFLTDVHLMLEKENQNPVDVLNLFEWALQDKEKRGDFNGWAGIVSTNIVRGKPTTPAHKLRVFLTKIKRDRDSKAKRTFAPASDDKKAIETAQAMKKRAI
jgi:predicted transcriptional regulator